MQNLDIKNKALVLMVLLPILAVVIWINLADPLKTNAQKPAEVEIDPKYLDPAKDFKSLDNYLTFTSPPNWEIKNQIDEKLGEKTNLSLTSPNFEASSSGEVLNGVKVWVSRKYDLNAEQSLNNKLTATYPIYDYNIRNLNIGGKNAMTLHEDYNGHNRFIYIATLNHLWTITISAKNLEEEQKFDAEITGLLNSITFKD